MKLLNSKGQVFGSLGQLATGIAALSIALVVTFLIISQGQAQIETTEGLNGSAQDCETSLSCNATNTLTEAVDDIPSWVPLIIIAVIGMILLGLVKGFK